MLKNKTKQMKTSIKIFSLSLILPVLLFLTGCTRMSSNPHDALSNASANFTITPTDNQAGVSVDQKIQIQFADPVDPLLVENYLHLISEFEFTDSNCRFDSLMNHSNMGMSMRDTSKMNHMDQYHAIGGRFTWSDGNKLCTFTPDSLLKPNTSYMIHIGRGMMESGYMGGMGDMGGHGGSVPQGHMMLHFKTKESSGNHGHH